MDPTPAASRPAAATRHQRAVILVEDDESLRRALVRVLRASGFEVMDYASAEALLMDFACERADCMVVDLNLPAMSGLDLVDHLRQRGMRLPVVAISAHDEASVRTAVAHHGVERFLAKPFHGTALLAVVNELL